jgi:hypothetical protein
MLLLSIFYNILSSLPTGQTPARQRALRRLFPGVSLRETPQNQNRFAVLIRARDRSGNTGGFTAGKAEELERIARFPAFYAGNAPKKQKILRPPGFS